MNNLVLTDDELEEVWAVVSLSFIALNEKLSDKDKALWKKQIDKQAIVIQKCEALRIEREKRNKRVN